MIRIFKTAIVLLATSLIFLVACGGGSEKTESSTQDQTSTEKPSDEIIITIGNLSDLTGVGSSPISITNKALGDMVRYYNEQNLIPGVELELITYDGQFNPAMDIPGYEWLKERGANLIWTAVPATATTLKPLLERDQTPLFTLAPAADALDPPGYVFAPGNVSVKSEVYTLLEWVTINDPDFNKYSPAKLGATYWAEAYGEAYVGGAEEYAKTHPDVYEWQGGYLPAFSFVWTTEVEELSNCDYVLLPAPVNNFIEEYRYKGYTGKFLCTSAHSAFLGMLRDADLWTEFDETLHSRPARWWNEEGPVIDLAKQLLYTNHPDTADKIIYSGAGYLVIDMVYVMLEVIKQTVEDVGAEHFTSQSLYESAQSFSHYRDGVELDSFNESKRTSRNYFRIYETRAAEKDLFQVGPEWYPVVPEQ